MSLRSIVSITTTARIERPSVCIASVLASMFPLIQFVAWYNRRVCSSRGVLSGGGWKEPVRHSVVRPTPLFVPSRGHKRRMTGQNERFVTTQSRPVGRPRSRANARMILTNSLSEHLHRMIQTNILHKCPDQFNLTIKIQ